MFFRKADRINELVKMVHDLERQLSQQQYNQSTVQQTANHYRELYLELEKNRPRTLEEQLIEARRVNQELNDKKTLVWLQEQNCKLTKENK